MPLPLSLPSFTFFVPPSAFPSPLHHLFQPYSLFCALLRRSRPPTLPLFFPTPTPPKLNNSAPQNSKLSPRERSQNLNTLPRFAARPHGHGVRSPGPELRNQGHKVGKSPEPGPARGSQPWPGYPPKRAPCPARRRSARRGGADVRSAVSRVAGGMRNAGEWSDRRLAHRPRVLLSAYRSIGVRPGGEFTQPGTCSPHGMSSAVGCSTSRAGRVTVSAYCFRRAPAGIGRGPG